MSRPTRFGGGSGGGGGGGEVTAAAITSALAQSTPQEAAAQRAAIGADPFVTLTDGATVAWATGGAPAPAARLLIGGDRTLNLTGTVPGQTGVLLVTQAGVGGHSLTLPAGSRLPGASALFLSAAPGTTDRLVYEFDGTTLRWDVRRDV